MRTPASLIIFAMIFVSSAIAEPRYKNLRFDENYEYLQDPEKRTDFFDPIKYIPLSSNPHHYISLGGEIRERFEYFNNALWGEKEDDGYLLQRYMLHSDIHFSKAVRFFFQLKSGLISWNNNSPRPTDKDELDIHQLFAESAFSDDLSLRTGRQELLFGSQRLISVRETPNVRQSFDGIRAGKFGTSDLFLVRPVRTDPYVFDDDSDKETTFWGFYNVFPLALLSSGDVDLYYLGIENDAEFDQESGHEIRQSVGTRLSGEGEAIDYNFEAVYQFGRFSGGNINAWSLASDSGYSLSDIPWKPRFGLKADLASGDKNPDSKILNTFNPLFPKGSYFSQAGIIGPLNIMDLHPSIDISPTDSLKFTFECDFFWRASLNDGIYGVSGNLLRSGKDVSGRYIGSLIQTVTSWQIDRHISFNFAYIHFFPGEFVENSGPDKDIDYVSVWGTYKF